MANATTSRRASRSHGRSRPSELVAWLCGVALHTCSLQHLLSATASIDSVLAGGACNFCNEACSAFVYTGNELAQHCGAGSEVYALEFSEYTTTQQATTQFAHNSQRETSSHYRVYASKADIGERRWRLTAHVPNGPGARSTITATEARARLLFNFTSHGCATTSLWSRLPGRRHATACVAPPSSVTAPGGRPSRNHASATGRHTARVVLRSDSTNYCTNYCTNHCMHGFL